MKISLLLLLSLVGSTQIKAQIIKHKNAIGLELLGSGDIAAICYGRFYKNQSCLATSFSWIPGTWRLNGVNDRSFLYIPVSYGFYRLLGNWMISGNIGSSQTIVMYKESSDDFFIQPQIGLIASYPSNRKLRFNLSSYAKLPYEVQLNLYGVNAYRLPSTLLWPGLSIQYAF
ncbi:MAG: hypothetical protein ACOVON_00855 [Sediminibacterium sp.]